MSIIGINVLDIHLYTCIHRYINAIAIETKYIIILMMMIIILIE